MSKPSILFINRVYPPMRGASGRVMQDLAYALVAKGWKVSVITTGGKNDNFIDRGVEITTVKAIKSPKKFFGYCRTSFKLLRAGMKTPKHDIILTLTDPPMLVNVGCMIASRKKSHHVHWCHDMYPDLFTALGVKVPKFCLKRAKAKSRRAMKRCDEVVTVGRCMMKRLTHTGVDPQKVKFIPNWSDSEMFNFRTHKNNKEIVQKYKAIAKRPEEMFRDASPKFRILYAGNIGRAHSMSAIMDAAELLSEYKEIEFVFVGDSRAHDLLAEERTRRSLENVKFLPYQPIEHLREIMESGDVHLISMRPETTGMLVPCKFYSALAVGRPSLFIGKEESEIGQVITEYGAGKIISGEDLAKKLAEAIYAYRHDGDSWFAAQEGALRAAQTYHPSQSLKTWVDLLERVRVRG